MAVKGLGVSLKTIYAKNGCTCDLLIASIKTRILKSFHAIKLGIVPVKILLGFTSQAYSHWSESIKSLCYVCSC